MGERCVIVGGGQAADQAVFALRQAGYAGAIELIAEEPELPYPRPPLSKGFLTGGVAEERLPFRAAHLYEQLEVTLSLNATAVELDPDRQIVQLSNSTSSRYDALLLSTGSTPRRLSVPGADLPGIHYLRTLSDGRRLRPRLRPGSRLAVIGGGFLGLEAAAAAASLGAGVTVIEAQPRLMQRAVGSTVADHFLALHEAHGSRVLTSTLVREFKPSGGQIAVVCDHGDPVVADDVLVAVGVEPRTELAQAAGLECRNGIVVDSHARTQDRAVLAAGDCTNHRNDLLGRELRLESVHNAIEQAKVAAAAIAGSPRPYAQIPWFWSEQFDAKLQMIGLLGEGLEVELHGEPASGAFAVSHFDGERLVALEAVNTPRAFMRARKLFSEGAPILRSAWLDSAAL